VTDAARGAPGPAPGGPARLGRRQARAVLARAERVEGRATAAIAAGAVISGLLAIPAAPEHAGPGGGSLEHQGDPRMRSETLKSVAVVGALVAGGAAQAQQAVQWRVEDGGNGHWYLVDTGSPDCWEAAREFAELRGGYLATLTSQQELAFIASRLPNTNWFYLGGYQDATQPDYSEPAGGWRWVTGEPWIPIWGGPNQPDGVDGPSAACLYRAYGLHDTGLCVGSGTWQCVVEWSADCNNDGIVDYGQILLGQLPDENHNNTPDTCECNQHPELGACCTGDLYVDRRVDGADLAALLSHWGAAPAGGTPEDLNHDGTVDGNDLGILLAHWGPCGQ
jgi:hypothetical protein